MLTPAAGALRRFALFSDIHGNIVALESVLADIETAGIEERYCLGDLVGYGPEPAAVVERVRSLGVPTIRGNYDDGIGDHRGECGCYYATDEARANGAASYAFTEAVLSDTDAAWLAALPGDLRLDVGGIRVLLAHGSPRKINEYLLPDRTDTQLARLADGAQADVVCVGHVHIPYHRSVAAPDGRTVHYVSSGSVGKPKDGDPRAAWVEVVIGSREAVVAAATDDTAVGPVRKDAAAWVGAVVHRVTYDVEAVAAAVIAKGLPPKLADALRTA